MYVLGHAGFLPSIGSPCEEPWADERNQLGDSLPSHRQGRPRRAARGRDLVRRASMSREPQTPKSRNISYAGMDIDMNTDVRVDVDTKLKEYILSHKVRS